MAQGRGWTKVGYLPLHLRELLNQYHTYVIIVYYATRGESKGFSLRVIFAKFAKLHEVKSTFLPISVGKAAHSYVCNGIVENGLFLIDSRIITLKIIVQYNYKKRTRFQQQSFCDLSAIYCKLLASRLQMMGRGLQQFSDGNSGEEHKEILNR